MTKTIKFNGKDFNLVSENSYSLIDAETMYTIEGDNSYTYDNQRTLTDMVIKWVKSNAPQRDATFNFNEYRDIGVTAPDAWLKAKGYDCTSGRKLDFVGYMRMVFDRTAFTNYTVARGYGYGIEYALSVVGKKSPAKAIFSVLHKFYSITVPDDVLTLWGNKFDALKPSPSQSLLISLGCEGGADKYAHEDSCWWGGYTTARNILEGNKGGAFITLKERSNSWDYNTVDGRMWFMPVRDTDATILFNNYGGFASNSGLKWAEAINKLLGYSKVSEISFDPNGMYINGNRAYVLHNGLEYAELENISTYRYDKRALNKYEDEHTCSCYNCECDIDEDDSYTDDDGDTYCSNCWYETHADCDSCGNSAYRDDMNYVNGDLWCENCTDNRATMCCACDEYHPDSQKHYDTPDGMMCDDCFDESQYNICDVCHEIFDASEVKVNCICDECMPDDETYTDETVLYAPVPLVEIEE